MHTHALLLASLLTVGQAWVQFPGAAPLRQNPWDEPTPKNLETPLPTPTLSDGPALLDATPSASITTIPTMTTIPYPISSVSSPSQSSLPLHAQLLRWIKRQGGQVSNPGVAQPAVVSQQSPTTILSLQSKGNPIMVPYTQTFAKVPQQWPSASSGEIGLGTIQGQIGVVKTKRSEPMEILAEPTEAPRARWDDDEPTAETTTAAETRSRRRVRIAQG